MSKIKNSRPTTANLEALAAELGIPDDVALEVIEIAGKTGDPAAYIRNYKAQVETMAAAEGAELPGGQIEPPLEPDISGVDLSVSILEIPMAVKIGGRPVDATWPYRQSHVDLQLDSREPHLKDALCRLFHGLQESNARLRGRTEDEPPRTIKSSADAIKWLLEQISL